MVIEDDDAADLAVVEFPSEAAVVPEKASFKLCGDSIVVTIPIDSDYTIDDNDGSNPLPSELRVDNVGRLHCRFCSQPLSQAPTRILPLPSPYWKELSELWYCHNKESALISKAEIKATPGLFMSGETHLVLHPSDVEEECLATSSTPVSLYSESSPLDANLVSNERTQTHCHLSDHLGAEDGDVDEIRDAASGGASAAPIGRNPEEEAASHHADDEEEDDSIGVHLISCPRCDIVVGELHLGADQTEVHLHKFRLSSGASVSADDDNHAMGGATENVFSVYSIETYVSTKMLSVSRARTCQRAVILCPERNLFIQMSMMTARAWIQVGPSLQQRGVSTSSVSVSESHSFRDDEAFSPAIRILYKLVEGEMTEEIANWVDVGDVEIMEFPIEACRELERVLDERSHYLPPSCSTMDEWTVSFLRRFPSSV